MRPVLLRRALIAGVVLLLIPALRAPAAAAPEGTLTWGIHVTLAPYEDLRLKAPR